MKFAVMGMVTLACGAALAIDSEVWKDYKEWRWEAFSIPGTNSLNECRSVNDLTQPLHGPWLSLPSETGKDLVDVTVYPWPQPKK